MLTGLSSLKAFKSRLSTRIAHIVLLVHAHSRPGICSKHHTGLWWTLGMTGCSARVTPRYYCCHAAHVCQGTSCMRCRPCLSHVQACMHATYTWACQSLQLLPSDWTIQSQTTLNNFKHPHTTKNNNSNSLCDTPKYPRGSYVFVDVVLLPLTTGPSLSG